MLVLMQALPVRAVDGIARFLIAKGLPDPVAEVSLAAVSAGREIMQQYGADLLPSLLALLEVRCVKYNISTF